MTTLPVVVIESHQHCLEHIHSMLRKRHAKRRHHHHYCHEKDEPWSMLHFDAHPDLACPHPSIPASACYQPRKKWQRRPLPTPCSTAASSSSSSRKRQMEFPEENNKTNKNKNNSVMVTEPCKEEDTVIDNNDDNENDESSADGKNLYELLDSTATGIAEWILPLVLAANLRRVDWIRPVIPSQPGSPRGLETFPLGEHAYHVGAWIAAPENESVAKNTDSKNAAVSSFAANRTFGLESSHMLSVTSFLDLPVSAVVKVDCDCSSYYMLDDVDCVAPTRELVLAQQLHLSVSELRCLTEACTAAGSGDCMLSSDNDVVPKTHLGETETSSSSPWILDICLDYFACQNPFLIELERISPAVTTALTSCVHHSLFYNHQRIRHVGDNKMDHDWCQCPPNKHRDELSHYRTLLSELISLAAESKAEEHRGTTDCKVRDSALKSEATTMTAGRSRARELLDSLTGYYCQHQPSRALLQGLVHAMTTTVASLAEEARSKLIQLAVEAIPNLCMPHDPVFSAAAKEGVLHDEVLSSLERVRIELTKEKTMVSKDNDNSTNHTYGYKNNPPFMVTVCRSAADGFTPVAMVDELQARVLSMVHDCYCNCKTMDNRSSFSHPTTCKSSNATKEIATAASKPLDQEAASASSECRLHIVFDYGPWEGSSIEM